MKVLGIFCFTFSQQIGLKDEYSNDKLEVEPLVFFSVIYVILWLKLRFHQNNLGYFQFEYTKLPNY